MTERLIRTDVHRPSAITPSEYEWVAFEYAPRSGDTLGDAMFRMEERARIRAHMERTGGTYSRHEHGGNCMVCGNANAIYTVLFYHAPTNSYVRMGQDCAAKCEMTYDEERFNAFRTAIRREVEARTGKRKAETACAERGLLPAWEVYCREAVENTPNEELTIRDVLGKMVKYGSLSDRQWNLLHVLVRKISERGERTARFAAETAAALPIPVDFYGRRVEIEGEVIAVKEYESGYGYNGGTYKKMLVKHRDGWKVWGTKPAFLDAERGDKVRFTAMIARSRDGDEKFGAFSRPSGAVNLTTDGGGNATVAAAAPAAVDPDAPIPF